MVAIPPRRSHRDAGADPRARGARRRPGRPCWPTPSRRTSTSWTCLRLEGLPAQLGHPQPHLASLGLQVALWPSRVSRRDSLRSQRCALHSRSASKSAVNVSSTVPRTTRSRWLLIRSSSIAMTLPTRLGVFSVTAAPSGCPGAFSHLQFSQIRGRQPYSIVRKIHYVITSSSGEDFTGCVLISSTRNQILRTHRKFKHTL